MKLNLQRPLAFFDLETTGTDIGKDRIVEIALVKVAPDGSIVSKPEKTGKEHRFLINPGIPIPKESSIVHGIYDTDVKDAPTFSEVAPWLFKFLFDCDLGGFNSNKFDIPLLAEEFLRAGIDFSLEGRNLIDVQVLFHMMEPRNLKAGYKFYCGRELEDAHEALPDALATYEIFKAQLERYENTEIDDGKGGKYKPVVNDMAAIHKLGERKKKVDLAGHLIFNDEGKPCFNFGKYRNICIEEVFIRDPGYFSWVLNADFPLYTKKVLTELRNATKIA